MRTTLADHAADRRGNDSGRAAQGLARDNPRRQREPHDECEDNNQQRGVTGRSPLRHGVQHVRDDLRRLGRT